MINKDLTHSKDVVYGLRRLTADVNRTSPVSSRNERRLQKKERKKK